MTRYLCISVTLLDPLFHGKCDGGEPEWPPSPLRLFQALLRGARTGCRDLQWSKKKVDSFYALEKCAPPLIIAPEAHRLESYTLFIPNNDSDKEFDRQNRLTSKKVHPHRLPDELEDRQIHYLWRIGQEDGSLPDGHAKLLRHEARYLLTLGWGIDQAVGDGCILTEAEACDLSGIRWTCRIGKRHANPVRRVPKKGTLDDLKKVYESFLNSVDGKQYHPPLKPSVFNRVIYASPSSVQRVPYRVFELRHDNGEWCRYPQSKLIHIAGMVRHLAIERMKYDPPRERDVANVDLWIDRYVAGHSRNYPGPHRQFSYLPLPSIGAPHEPVDPAVRRVMIVAPLGDDQILEHLARRLAGQQLQEKYGVEFGEAGPPTLIRDNSKKVTPRYTAPANRWASVTPVILPGHDDKKLAKRQKLIEKALAQSGIEQPCDFEASPISCFRKSLTAHKYAKDSGEKKKRWQFVDLPPYLRDKTWVHLTLTFNVELQVPGPLAVGAGRHCGFGLMAACD